MNMSRFREAIRGGCTLSAAMDCQVHWKGGAKTSSDTQIPKWQQDAMKKSQSMAANVKFDKFYGGSDNFDPVAGFTDGQTQALGSITNTGAGLQGVYDSEGYDALKSGLGTYDPNKTGLTGAIDASNNRLDWNYNTQVAPQVRQGAVDSGQYGSTRHGVAEGIALTQMNQQKMDSANSLAFQDQQNFNNQRNNLLQNLSGVTKGMTSGAGAVYDSGALQQKQDQAEIQGALEKWAYENNVDAEQAKLYMQAVNGTGSAGGSSTTTGPKGPGALQRAAGGAAAGAMAGATIGAAGGPIGMAGGALIGAGGAFLAG